MVTVCQVLAAADWQQHTSMHMNYREQLLRC
jgi:hypothetical protein